MTVKDQLPVFCTHSKNIKNDVGRELDVGRPKQFVRRIGS